MRDLQSDTIHRFQTSLQTSASSLAKFYTLDVKASLSSITHSIAVKLRSIAVKYALPCAAHQEIVNIFNETITGFYPGTIDDKLDNV